VDALAALLSSLWMQALGVGALVLVAVLVLSRYYQRCPHCDRFVARAHRQWVRCPGCGRQYNRSVPSRR
jgi:hypothetical protein